MKLPKIVSKIFHKQTATPTPQIAPLPTNPLKSPISFKERRQTTNAKYYQKRKLDQDLTLEQKRMLLYTTHGCQFGNCKTCNRVCHINTFKAELQNLKPSFCPGDKTKCPRSEIQGCPACKAEHLDLNVLHS